MKRQLHSSSPPSSPLSNSQISDELEPAPKRPRIFISSPTPPPDDDNEIDGDDSGDDEDDEEEEEEEIIIDEPIIPSVTITEDSQSEHNSEEEQDDDDDIIEIEQQNLDLFSQETDNAIIVVSDSESDDNSDDQGIDVTDDILPSVSSVINASMFSPDIEDVELIQEEMEDALALMEDDEEEEEEEVEEDLQSLEIMNNDDDNDNHNDLIDLTDDEPISICCSPILPERKLSVDVQQCPICLETLSHLQRTGIYLIITRCRHVMCTLCSRQLLATSSRCPLCRENVSSTTLMPYCILT